jgi:ribosomal protein L29
MSPRATENTARELRHLSVEGLRARADALLASIVSLRFHGVTKEKNVKKMRAFKADRARVLTVLQEHRKATS